MNIRLLITLLITLWTGAVLCIAFIAAPAAFQVLPDRALAGSVAAQLFKVEAYGSLLVALLSWFALRPGVDAAQAEKPRVEWTLWVALLLILICTVLGYFALTPQLQEIKVAQGSGSAAYQRLHGLSMGLYALKSLAWAALSWLMLRRIGKS